MTSSGKSLIKYGPLAAAGLICAALAGLGSFHGLPAIGRHTRAACAVVVAAAMMIQGGAMFPRSWPSRFIVKPHVLAAGSLLLFAGAAVLLVLLLAGCTPAAGGPRPAHINFSVVNEQFRGAWFARPSLGTLTRNAAGENARLETGRLPAVATRGPAALCRRLGALKTGLVRMHRAEVTAALSRRHINEKFK